MAELPKSTISFSLLALQMILAEAINIYKKELSGIYSENECLHFISMLLNYSVNSLIINKTDNLDEQHIRLLMNALSSIKKHVPIQYVVGEAEFYGLKFKVDHHVLIPRPETEELVNWYLESINHTNALCILDIGTGSGCIPITIKKKSPNSNLYAIDISKEALSIAKQNALLNGVDVDFIELDILSKEIDGNFDIIISNPPYIKWEEASDMEPNVLDNEPHLALFVDNHDPLLFYRVIANQAIKKLNPNGYLFFEVNAAFGAEVVNLLKEVGFNEVILRKDMQGKDRMIRALKIN